MNHKRGRPKNRRAGCLMCKSWKINGAKKSALGGRSRIILELRKKEDTA